LPCAGANRRRFDQRGAFLDRCTVFQPIRHAAEVVTDIGVTHPFKQVHGLQPERSSGARTIDGNLLIEIGNQLPIPRLHIHDRKIDRSRNMAVRERFFRHDVEDHERAIFQPP
jgi:hypothetical protein